MTRLLSALLTLAPLATFVWAGGAAVYAQESQLRALGGVSAVAWTALKAGRIPEALATIQEALRRGTRDARLFYHTGMIARGGGDDVAAREYLQRAIALNPRFDPLHAPIAERALEE